MSPAVIISIVIGVVLVLGAVVLVTAARRTDVRGAGALSRETVKRDRDVDVDLPAAPTGREVELAARSSAIVAAPPAAPVKWTPPDEEAVAVSRRQFLNRANTTLMGAGLTTFAAASFVAFLWPSGASGFGGKVNVGKYDDIISSIRSNGGFYYSSTARSWITQYPSDALPKAQDVAAYQPVYEGMEAGLVAMYQKCPHLGCRVPECKTSQWFECPCHGSQYNRVGEKKAGPAPRGMDHFSLTVGPTGDVIVDTGVVHPGAPLGTNTTGQEAEGPHCITGDGGH
jgi:cytochrome b6-f complex iron-sulfur subunit